MNITNVFLQCIFQRVIATIVSHAVNARQIQNVGGAVMRQTQALVFAMMVVWRDPWHIQPEAMLLIGVSAPLEDGTSMTAQVSHSHLRVCVVK